MTDCPKYLPADNPARIHRDAYIAKRIIEGVSQTKIASEIGITQGQVSRLKDDDRINEWIKESLLMEAAALPEITKGKIEIATADISNPETRIVTPSEKLKAAEAIDQDLGKRGAHTSIHIEKMCQQNNTIELQADMMDIFRQLQAQADTIDVPTGD